MRPEGEDDEQTTPLAALPGPGPLATSCTFYRVKDVDGKALAAKGTKGRS